MSMRIRIEVRLDQKGDVEVLHRVYAEATQVRRRHELFDTLPHAHFAMHR